MGPHDDEFIIERMQEPEAIFEISWPGESGLTDEQLMKI